MKLQKVLLATLLLVVLAAGATGASAQETPVVRALLFYSPTCPHCHQVINEDLPPLFEKYQDQLLILFIDVTTEGGGALFGAALQELNLMDENAGAVPYLIVGEIGLVGSVDIPAQLPGIIEEGLVNGGIDWPPSPTLIEVLTAEGFIDPETGEAITPTPDPAFAAAQETATSQAEPAAEVQVSETTEELTEPTPTETAVPTAEAETDSGSDSGNMSVIDTELPVDSSGQDFNFSQFGERFAQDKVGNSVAVVLLVGMISLVIWIGIQFMKATTPKMWPEYILPILLVIGLAIAIYLANIEVTGNKAICGPVGDCNAVQESEYSKLFGVIPVAILGIAGYVMLGISWFVARTSSGSTQFYAKIGMFLVGLMGLLFFIYLTFLEPFVIGATCAWCIASATIFSKYYVFC
jgi:uncharacterized membrane protein